MSQSLQSDSYLTQAETHYPSGETYWVRRQLTPGYLVVAISGPLHYSEYRAGQHPPATLGTEDVEWANTQVFRQPYIPRRPDGVDDHRDDVDDYRVRAAEHAAEATF